MARPLPALGSRGHPLSRTYRSRERQSPLAFGRMLHACAIAQRHAVLFARAAARLVVSAFGEERRDHAMLHVVERHRMVHDDLGPRTERRSEEIDELRGVLEPPPQR